MTNTAATPAPADEDDERNLGGRPYEGKPFPVRLSDELKAKLDEWADAHGMSRAAAIREAVATLLTRPANYYRIPVRNVLIEETHPYSHMTVRTCIENGEPIGHALFVFGTRRGDYKTDRGLIAAIARYADETTRHRKQGTRDDAWNLDDVHARLAARFAAGETPVGYVPA